MDRDRLGVQRAHNLSDFLRTASSFDIVAIDIPIGLLDAYEIGGRACDRAARALLAKRASSVFPAPVRSTLGSASWEEACERSKASAPRAKAVSKQTYGILNKINEVDQILRSRPILRDVIREVHPEVSFCELTGAPMVFSKKKASGRDERRYALKKAFATLDAIEVSGKICGLHIEDILDASVACWSAQRLATGRGRSIPEAVPFDSVGLPMAIWV